MSASAAHEIGREELTRAIIRFARALCVCDDAGREGLSAPLNDAAQRAISSQPGEDSASGRVAAYRAVLRRMLGDDALGEGAARSARPIPSPRMATGQQAAAMARPRRADSSRTLQAFARLEPVERAALLLVGMERFTYAEAAAALDLGDDEFVSALARGREAFAARLAAGAQGRPRLRLVE